MLSLLLAASVVTAVDAERAFIRDAHATGQWTAFRKWADGDAVMFIPRPVWAEDFLKNRKDPAKSIDWAPAESWVSCDGQIAINRGPWKNASGAHGYFTTVWVRDGASWRWVYDGGADLTVSIELPSEARVTRASCADRSKISAVRDRIVPASREIGKAAPDTGRGRSTDGTLVYEWKSASDGARHFLARLWTGKAYRIILDQNVPAPKR